jgi:hypothetical protein
MQKDEKLKLLEAQEKLLSEQIQKIDSLNTTLSDKLEKLEEESRSKFFEVKTMEQTIKQLQLENQMIRSQSA